MLWLIFYDRKFYSSPIIYFTADHYMDKQMIDDQLNAPLVTGPVWFIGELIR